MIGQVFDVIDGLIGFIRKQIGKTAHEWSKFALEHPEQAALELEFAARMIDAKANTFKIKRRAKRWHARARAMREQAQALRLRSVGRDCGYLPDPEQAPWRPLP